MQSQPHTARDKHQEGGGVNKNKNKDDTVSAPPPRQRLHNCLPPLDEKEPHPADSTATRIGGGFKAKKEEKSHRMQILRKIQRKQPSTQTSQQHPLFKMQLKQEVDRVEARVGVQENWRRLQRVRRLL